MDLSLTINNVLKFRPLLLPPQELEYAIIYKLAEFGGGIVLHRNIMLSHLLATPDIVT